MTEDRQTQTSQDWWLGLADLLTVSVAEGARGIERFHLSIADETFNVLARIPITQPVSEPVRVIHHRISRLCYRSVSEMARAGNAVVNAR